MRPVRQNYTVIASLNTLALALSIPSGLVSPGLTALLSKGSAVLATLNTLRPMLKYGSAKTA
jgi:cation transport ATPase